MGNIWCSEDYVDAEKHLLLGNSEPYETYCETPGELFRASRKEYGRCTSRIYIDTSEGMKSVGWVFLKRQAYEDSPKETYLQETWVTLYKGSVKMTREVEYLEI